MTVEKTELSPSKPSRATTRKPAARKTAASKTAVPAGAKLPSDHKPAKSEVEGEPTYVVEWKGHDYEIPRDNLNDAELLEFFTDDNFVGAIRKLIGMEGWKLYKIRHRDRETGRIDVEDTSDFLNHILQEVDRKNS